MVLAVSLLPHSVSEGVRRWNSLTILKTSQDSLGFWPGGFSLSHCWEKGLFHGGADCQPLWQLQGSSFFELPPTPGGVLVVAESSRVGREAHWFTKSALGGVSLVFCCPLCIWERTDGGSSSQESTAQLCPLLCMHEGAKARIFTITHFTG